MLTIWGRKTSSNVQALMWCVGELGLPYTRHDAGHVLHVPDRFAHFVGHALILDERRDAGLPSFDRLAMTVERFEALGDLVLGQGAPRVRLERGAVGGQIGTGRRIHEISGSLWAPRREARFSRRCRDDTHHTAGRKGRAALAPEQFCKTRHESVTELHQLPRNALDWSEGNSGR